MPTAAPDLHAATARIKAAAARLGFAACGVLPAGPARTHAFYEAWLAAGYGGEMGYLRRHAEPKRDPAALLPGAQSVLVLAHAYDAPVPPPPAAPGDPPRGLVSRYARGTDYHDVLHAKLERLAASVAEALGRPVRHRACVDSAPLMERELAARAGLGWVGRNAMLIHWRLGSWLFLAELLLDAPLAYDAAVPARPGRRTRRVPPPAPLPELALGLRESCGACTACIAACPTGAIVGDKTVDAQHCISYLTIELKGPVPRALREPMGAWVFGCDVCQDVCPWNRRAPPATEPALRGDGEAAAPLLAGLLGLDDAAFRARYRHTALWRPRRRGLLRNAAIALGNRIAERRSAGLPSDPHALEALRRALDDREPLVRGAAAWALGRAAAPEAQPWLRAALASEADPDVQGELREALGEDERGEPVAPGTAGGADQPRR
jgi:epoxyqueuosine reductase